MSARHVLTPETREVLGNPAQLNQLVRDALTCRADECRRMAQRRSRQGDANRSLRARLRLQANACTDLAVLLSADPGVPRNLLAAIASSVKDGTS